MKRLLEGSLLLVLGIVLGRMFEGMQATAAGAGTGGGVVACSSANGDVNADGTANIADALALLNHLFAGTPAVLAPLCAQPLHLPALGHTEGRFVDNSDGTVTDNGTGLMWQQASVGEGLVSFMWEEAVDYCADLEFAGHTDWRLPNVRELESLIKYDEPNRLIDTIFETTPLYEYWTSTIVHGHPRAYTINLDSPGYECPIQHREKNFNQANVRAVRSLP